MGATTEGAPYGGSTGLDTVRRYHTTCKVRIDSHRFTEPMFISDDVQAIQTAKTIKGPGQANLTLVASRNWLNYIAPNDLINIYFNIGDGDGWTRTFFGFVDRIEENYSVEESGAPKTLYTLAATDFYKAFSKTQVYFNPQLAGRSDLGGAFFGTPNIGGLALQTQGVRVFGAPSDLVINLVLLLMGFGTQFTMPSSYPANLASKLRQQRAEFTFERLTLSDFAREAISSGGFQQLLDTIRTQAEGAANSIANAGDSQEDRIQELAQESGISAATIASTNAEGGQAAVTRLFSEDALDREVTRADLQRAGPEDRGALNVLNSTLSNAPTSLLDVVDPITYIERRAMDGYHAGASIWQRQGSLVSIIKAVSHEIVNELVFDLRPVTALNTMDTAVGNELRNLPYSRAEDEIGGNVSTTGEDNGVQYMPAIMMREYPFATIEGMTIDATQILGGRGASGEDTFCMYFGAIWQDGPNVPGRHIVEIPNINVADLRDGLSEVPGTKHLDVAVISETEIVKSTFGRSDNDHFNLLEFWVDGLLGNDQKFYMHDLLPIITPIHIMRHGLRVRSLTTRFARFSVETARIATEQPSTAAQEEAVASEEEAVPPPPAPTLIAPIAMSDHGTDTWSPNGVTRNVVVYNDNRGVSGAARHGYRKKTRLGPNGAWVMHNGIDISCPNGLEVKAIADGEIVLSVPNGRAADGGLRGFRFYGNMVLIRHTNIPGVTLAPNSDGDVVFYSLYAHLETITSAGGWGAGLDSPAGGVRNFRARGFQGARTGQQPMAVSQGTVIGTIGNTGTRLGVRGPTGGTHLHFEIDRQYPSRNDSATPRRPFLSIPSDYVPTVYREGGTVTDDILSGSSASTEAVYRAASAQVRAARGLRAVTFWGGAYHSGPQRSNQTFGGVVASTGPVPATPADHRSINPVDFYTDHFSQNLVDLINNVGAVQPDITSEDVEADDEDRGGVPPEDPEEQDREGVSEEPPPLTTSGGVVVDSALVRKQVVRWALLNDLWFQHNLEYLNGRIEMRGAPEVRVGYRLDILEKNMSFYVEAVNHNWTFPGRMATALSVVRGQPNNPAPIYVLPPLAVFGATEVQRVLANSRLAHFFIVPDPLAVRRGIVLRQSNDNGVFQADPLGPVTGTAEGNYLDAPEQWTRFNERIIVPGSTEVHTGQVVDSSFDEECVRLVREALQESEGLEDQDNPSGVVGTNIDNQLPRLSQADPEDL